MNILYCTQSDSLRLFAGLHRTLANRLPLSGAGFVVADSLAYDKWLASEPSFPAAGFQILKEWEVTASPHDKPDLEKLRVYERELGGEAGLFGAIVADRRLLMGKDCAYTQDYRRRFSDEQLLGILQRGLDRVRDLFDDLMPDLVVGFICVTMLDYIVYLFAKARGVYFLNMRPTRVGDRVTLSTTLNDPSPAFAAAYQRILQGSFSDHSEAARAYVKRVREQHSRYEGVVSPSNRPALRVDTARFTRVSSVVLAVRNYFKYRRSIAVCDNHVPDPLRAMVFAALINPWRARRHARELRSAYVSPQRLATLRYALFPLHTEPEVSLLVYGRPYVNQIEVIRWVAMSLPADMVLVVKEHPWMVGKRSLGSYRKILNIPRVILAEPSTQARTLVQGAQLVAVITGSVALEAAMLGIPVVTFGDCPYNVLPPSMVRRCDDPRRLQALLRNLLDDHFVDDHALEAYVAAVMETSVSLNLYSVLLGKKNVHQDRGGDYERELEALAKYIVKLMADKVNPVSLISSAATW